MVSNYEKQQPLWHGEREVIKSKLVGQIVYTRNCTWPCRSWPLCWDSSGVNYSEITKVILSGARIRWSRIGDAIRFSFSSIWAIIFELATMYLFYANSEFLSLYCKMYIFVDFLDNLWLLALFRQFISIFRHYLSSGWFKYD